MINLELIKDLKGETIIKVCGTNSSRSEIYYIPFNIYRRLNEIRKLEGIKFRKIKPIFPSEYSLRDGTFWKTEGPKEYIIDTNYEKNRDEFPSGLYFDFEGESIDLLLPELCPNNIDDFYRCIFRSKDQNIFNDIESFFNIIEIKRITV